MKNQDWSDRISEIRGISDSGTTDDLHFVCGVRVMQDMLTHVVGSSVKTPAGQTPTWVSAIAVSAFADGRTLVRATNGEHEMAVISPPGACKTSSPGTFMMPGYPFRDFVRKLDPDANLTLRLHEGKARLTCGRSSVTFNLLGQSRDMPYMAEPKGQVVQVDKSIFLMTEEYVAHAMGNDQARHFLNGIYIHPSEDGTKLVFVATDGHRLSLFRSDCADAFSFLSCTLPSASTRHVQTILKLADQDENLGIIVDRHGIEFSCSRARLRSKLIEGEFPAYQRIFPPEDSIQTVARISARTLSKAVDRVQSVLSEKGENGIGITISDDRTIRLTARSSSRNNEAEEIVDLDDLDGEPNRRLHFNAKYVSEFLGSLPIEATVVIRLGDDTSATSWRHDGMDNRDYLLMPIRSGI